MATEQTERNMVIDQTHIWVSNIRKRSKYDFCSNGTDQNMGFVQTKQTADRKTGIKQTKIWLLTKPNRPKYGY